MFLFLALLIIPSVFALNIKIEKNSDNEVMVLGAGKPVVFNLSITNLGDSNSLEFYNLLGFNIFPIGTTPIGVGETVNIQLKVSPIEDFDHKGFYTFEYFIRGQDKSKIKESLTFKSIELKNAFEIGSGDIDPNSNSIKILLKNKVNFDFGGIDMKLSSAFFNIEESFSMGPKEEKEFEVKLEIGRASCRERV